MVCEGNRLLIGGQNGTSTLKAVCRVLEEMGCRYFMPGSLGEVFPRRKSLGLAKMTLTGKPGLVYRRIWGPEGSFHHPPVWQVWNGHGGMVMQTRHAWGGYAPVEEKGHPEYFSLRKDGHRKPDEWVCTSNPELRTLFARKVVAVAKRDRHPSLSPPDGVGYCLCPDCRAQDDPKSIEPSSGTVCVTNRYTDFFSDIAGRVAKECPDSILSFYCYADYTQPPTNGKPLAKNLCAWLAPLRYCRLHRTGSPNCPSRMQLEQMADGWAAVAGKLALRTYNFNLAECTVPFSLISVWKHDIPYFRKKGCIAIDLETPAFWEINGPHIYLSIRLAYDPEADADAIMEDYFMKFYGPKAGPVMKDYWMAIDRAFAESKCHSGSFFALQKVYTPDLLARGRALLDRAAEAAREDAAYSARVALHAGGFRNAEQYMEIREAMNQGDFARAKAVCDDLFARTKASAAKGTTNIYTSRYVERFVGNAVLPGAKALEPPAKRLQVLPDQWRFIYDEADEGLAKEYFSPRFDDSGWRMAATYSDTLDGQGIGEKQAVMWYRTSMKVPAAHGRLVLYFAEVDGASTVFVNGKKVAEYGPTGTKRRHGFEVEAGDAARPGDNVVAVRVDHRKISELFLGGLIRPVVLVDKGP